jgi:hypothetical protein
VTLGAATGVAPTLVKYNASGTTTMPTNTVSTNVTAPHSLRMKAQFTTGNLFLEKSKASL